MADLALFHAKHRTAKDTFYVPIGQAKYLIKQHDTGDFGLLCTSQLAVPARFVKMPCINSARMLSGVNAGNGEHVISRHITSRSMQSISP
jgi:hypothetical protein